MQIIKSLNESFRADQADKIINKFINVLRRTIKKPIMHTSIEQSYINTKAEKFKGFLAYIPTMKLFFRINFKLTASDEIVSFDFYQDITQFKKGYPSYTVDTTGLNVIQLIDLFEENITDIQSGNISFEDDFARDIAFGESIEKVSERTSVDRQQQLFSMWVEEDKEATKKLSTMKMPDAYADFLGADKFNSEVTNIQSFTKLAKAYLFSKGLTNVLFRTKRKGVKERPIEDQAKADEMEDIVANMGWEEKFEMMESSVEALVDGHIQSVIVYGSPGSGKSETIYSKLAKMGTEYQLFKGGFKNGDELFKILSKYNDNDILVFDDFDSALKPEYSNILKAALQNSKERVITWKDKKLSFSSGVIFISNLQKFDPAILSRSMAIRIDLTNEQMVDKMEKTLAAFHPEIPMDMKKQALAYINELKGGMKSVDYRLLQKVLIAMQIQPSKWKKFALFLMQSENI